MMHAVILRTSRNGCQLLRNAIRMSANRPALPCYGERAFCSSAPGIRRRRKPSAAAREKGSGAKANRTPFLSEHFRLDPGEVEAFLSRYNWAFRVSPEHAIVETCPFCPPNKGRAENMHKLYIVLDSGVFHCHRCKSKGNWFDLRKRAGMHEGRLMDPFSGKRGSVEANATAGGALVGNNTFPAHGQQDLYESELWNKHSAAVRYLTEKRGLNVEVLKKYGVGAAHFGVMEGGGWKRHLCVTFPMYDGEGQLMRHKVRSIETKSGMRLEPKGGAWGLFGLNVVPSDADEVVITEGEFDALSVYQSTGRHAISLPNGASSLPLALLPSLERFKTIHLWMDEDPAGQSAVKQFARKLGLGRCKTVRGTGFKDANDALRENKNIEELVNKSCVVPHEHLLRFEDIREEVLHELANVEIINGIKSLSLPRLNKLIKGHRRGELTIFSGHTGIGKTTLLSQLALDFCVQGVPTLWGSFEVSNVRLVGRILKQFQGALGDSSDLLENFDFWADRFAELPMYYMGYHGSEDMEKVVETMEYANYVHDCGHVVLDNLQFMTGGQTNGRDRFAVLDNTVGRLREFATVRNCHVSLVVHPRKEQDAEQIQTASVFGSAKATQEADNVIILQKGQNGRVLDIRKNRFDGMLGSISLRFDPKRVLYSQMDSTGHGWIDTKNEIEGSATAGREEGESRAGQNIRARDGEWGRSLRAYRSKKGVARDGTNTEVPRELRRTNRIGK